MTDSTQNECRIYRATVFLNSGIRITYNTEDESKARCIAGRFKFENLSSGTPVEIRGYGDQRMIFNCSNVDMAMFEELLPGMDGYNDMKERFIYH